MSPVACVFGINHRGTQVSIGAVEIYESIPVAFGPYVAIGWRTSMMTSEPRVAGLHLGNATTVEECAERVLSEYRDHGVDAPVHFTEFGE